MVNSLGVHLILFFFGGKLKLFKHLNLLSETSVHGGFKSVLLLVVVLTTKKCWGFELKPLCSSLAALALNISQHWHPVK